MSGADFHAGPFIAILAMAAATYLMRTSGYVLMSRVPVTPMLQRMLDALPGCVITATIVPVLFRSGSPAWLTGSMCTTTSASGCRLRTRCSIQR